MKREFLLILVYSLTIVSYSQNTVIIGSFPSLDNNPKPILCSELLAKLNWENIKKYDGGVHSVNEYPDSLITTYKYLKQGMTALVEIKCFKNYVLEFRCEVSNNNQNSNTYYFDKEVWLQYVRQRIPKLSSEYILPKQEPVEILKAFYELLGVDTRDEYGWYCEYGMVSKPTKRRLAVVELIKANRRDLLKKVLNFQNLQTQLYAADALIYLNYSDHRRIDEYKKEISENERKIDSLYNLKSDVKEIVKVLKQNNSMMKTSLEYLEKQLFSEEDWKTIYQIRDSNKEAKICVEFTGSYRVYTGKTSEILSEEVIREIPMKYKNFINTPCNQ